MGHTPSPFRPFLNRDFDHEVADEASGVFKSLKKRRDGLQSRARSEAKRSEAKLDDEDAEGSER
jgi:hypothetical protein